MKLITALGLATLALTACTDEDEMRNNTLPEGAVHIIAGIDGVQTRAPQLDAEGKGNLRKATYGECMPIQTLPRRVKTWNTSTGKPSCIGKT